MNTYRVTFRRGGKPRIFRYDVDASHPRTAIKRALRGMAGPADDVDVSCRLFARDIARHYSAPKVREVSP